MKGYLTWPADEHSHAPLMPHEHHISQQKAVSRADYWNGRNWVQGHDRQRTVSVFRKHAAGAWAQLSYSASSYSNHQTPGSWDGYRQMEAKHLGRFNDALLASTLTRRASADTGGKLHAGYTALPRILYRERTKSQCWPQNQAPNPLCWNGTETSWWGKHRQLSISNKPISHTLVWQLSKNQAYHSHSRASIPTLAEVFLECSQGLLPRPSG